MISGGFADGTFGFVAFGGSKLIIEPGTIFPLV